MLLLLQMTFVQALTGGGGWPMSVWLTPGELKPFYGGTYYPGLSMQLLLLLLLLLLRHL
jgi:uncharacterized protein YyaL (SSP411 family)